MTMEVKNSNSSALINATSVTSKLSDDKILHNEKTDGVSTEKSSEQTSIDLDEAFEVKFNSESENPDPEDIARGLSTVHKYYISTVITLTSTLITLVSSCWTFAAPQIMEHFHISREVSVLGISFYILGLGLGPLFLSPLSELYGRRTTYIYSLTLSLAFQCLTTWSTTIEGVMFGRFLSGFFGSSFLSVAGGSISDIYEKKDIGIPMAIYTTSPMLGPSLGPVISGALYHANYKWTFIVMVISSGLFLTLIVFTIPETYKPMLLIKKAKRLRKDTGDNRFYAPLEVTRREINLVSSVVLSARRPFGLLIYDPMMGVLTFYTGLTLAIIYLFFVAFDYIFSSLYNFTVMETACAYMGMGVGVLLVSPTSLLLQKRYTKKVKKNNGISNPEMRFEALFYGAFLSPIGLMIFAWTCYSDVHWMGPIIGSTIFGSGVFYIFTGVFSYTVDAYRKYAASAMACNSFVRSVMSAVFPLFGLQMYKGMGINWASFLLAMLSLILIPVPFLFTKYGSYLRSKSLYAWED